MKRKFIFLVGIMLFSSLMKVLYEKPYFLAGNLFINWQTMTSLGITKEFNMIRCYNQYLYHRLFTNEELINEISHGYPTQYNLFNLNNYESRLLSNNTIMQDSDFTETCCDINMDFVYVKGGTFQMGSYDGDNDEKPVHSVTVDDFYIGKYEVTVEQFIKFLNDIGCNSDGSYNGEELVDMDDSDCPVGYSGGRFYFKGSDYADKSTCPMIEVTWYGADEYAKWLSRKTGKQYRLPTEAEWEYTAGGGSAHQKWAGTNSESSLGSYAWYTSNSSSKTHPVGTKSPNELGIYDMSGNVYEWCSDWYGDYSSSSQTNPKGPSKGSYRVDRGGGWNDGAYGCRVAFRYGSAPTFSGIDLGFRLARRR